MVMDSHHFCTVNFFLYYMQYTCEFLSCLSSLGFIACKFHPMNESFGADLETKTSLKLGKFFPTKGSLTFLTFYSLSECFFHQYGSTLLTRSKAREHKLGANSEKLDLEINIYQSCFSSYLWNQWGWWVFLDPWKYYKVWTCINVLTHLLSLHEIVVCPIKLTNFNVPRDDWYVFAGDHHVQVKFI